MIDFEHISVIYAVNNNVKYVDNSMTTPEIHFPEVRLKKINNNDDTSENEINCILKAINYSKGWIQLSYYIGLSNLSQDVWILSTIKVMLDQIIVINFNKICG